MQAGETKKTPTQRTGRSGTELRGSIFKPSAPPDTEELRRQACLLFCLFAINMEECRCLFSEKWGASEFSRLVPLRAAPQQRQEFPRHAQPTGRS